MTMTAQEARTLRSLRQRFVKEIESAVAPLLWNSGFVHDAEKRPYRIYAFKDRRGKWRDRKLRHGIVVRGFGGFTEDGIITNSYGHGLATCGWDDIPVEDLRKLVSVAKALKPGQSVGA